MNPVFRGFVALALSVSLVAAGGYLFYSERQMTANAEAVDAVVIDSEVRVEYVERAGGGENEYESDYEYYPEVTYEYTVGDESYTSSNVFPGRGSQDVSREYAREIVEDHPTGEAVTAHVDPDSPATAYLIEDGRPIWRYSLGLVAGGVLTFVVGVLGVGSRFVEFGLGSARR